jgi:hypothetical protein
LALSSAPGLPSSWAVLQAIAVAVAVAKILPLPSAAAFCSEEF